MKISVLMSVYNEIPEQISAAVDSVLNQTYRNFELIIVNDNPDSDEMVKYLREIKKRDDRIVIISNEKNIGLAMSMNKAFAHSTGEIIARMDADDISDVTRFEKEYDFIVNRKYDLVCTNYHFIDDNSNYIDSKVACYNERQVMGLLPYGNTIHHPTTMMTRKIFECAGGYRDFPCAQDYDFWLRMLDKGAKMYMMSEDLFSYRVRSQSITSSRKIKQIATMEYSRILYRQRKKNGIDSYSRQDYENYLNKNGIIENGKKLSDIYNEGRNAKSRGIFSQLGYFIKITFTAPFIAKIYRQKIKFVLIKKFKYTSFKRTVKKAIIKVLGMDRVLYLFSKYKYFKSKKWAGANNRIKVAQGYKHSVKELQGRHLFFGYFDVKQFSNDDEKMLVTSVDVNAKTNKDVAYIGYYNIKDDKDEYVELTTTKAWCWQQGARLRFHPTDSNIILYNDMEDNKYVCREFDILKKQIVNTFSEPLYDIDDNMRYGIGINYVRLQRLRPGYGYDKIPDAGREDNAPENDGVFRLDLKTGEKKLLISIRELAYKNDEILRYQHYLNHLSFSPDGEHFIFFHIYAIEGYTKWKTRLYVMDINGDSLKILEDNDNVSHYSWKNNEEVLISLAGANKHQYYAMYNIVTGDKKIIGENVLVRDGHPSILKDLKQIVTDTYPDSKEFQHLFTYNMETGEKVDIMDVYSDPRLYMEKRCDLHPRVSESEKIISVDSTFSDRRRKIIVIRM